MNKAREDRMPEVESLDDLRAEWLCVAVFTLRHHSCRQMEGSELSSLAILHLLPIVI